VFLHSFVFLARAHVFVERRYNFSHFETGGSRSGLGKDSSVLLCHFASKSEWFTDVSEERGVSAFRVMKSVAIFLDYSILKMEDFLLVDIT
jgi:hypothetical protein